MKIMILTLLMSPFLLSLEKMDLECSNVELYFKSPDNGYKSKDKEFKVEFGSKNIDVSPAGVKDDNVKNCHVSGHHHLIINDAYDVLGNAKKPIPYGKNILHFGGGQTFANLSLPPGKYSLQLALGDYEHRPVETLDKNSLVLSEIIQIEVLP
tara:strand:+ start:3479 stop:3937 length:459 start_codon:yes stop_codon:yes gene_type:complete